MRTERAEEITRMNQSGILDEKNGSRVLCVDRNATWRIVSSRLVIPTAIVRCKS